MADFPALGGFSSREHQPSFSSIAGAGVGLRKPVVELTPEDFPALGSSSQQSQQQQQQAAQNQQQRQQQQLLAQMQPQSVQQSQRMSGSSSITPQQTREQILMSNLLGGNASFAAAALVGGNVASASSFTSGNADLSGLGDRGLNDIVGLSDVYGSYGPDGAKAPRLSKQLQQPHQQDSLQPHQQQKQQQEDLQQQQKQLQDVQQLHRSQLSQQQQQQQQQLDQDQRHDQQQKQSDSLQQQQQHSRVALTSGMMGSMATPGLQQVFGLGGAPSGLRKQHLQQQRQGIDAAGMNADILNSQPMSASTMLMASGMRPTGLSRLGPSGDPSLQHHSHLHQHQQQQQQMFDYGSKSGNDDSMQFQLGATPGASTDFGGNIVPDANGAVGLGGGVGNLGNLDTSAFRSVDQQGGKAPGLSNMLPHGASAGMGSVSGGGIMSSGQAATGGLIPQSQLPGSNSLGSTTSPADRYGILGLIDVIRMTSEDTSMLALGCDLTSLGLQLNSGEPIYGTLMTPFSDQPSVGADPPYTLPQSYAPTNPPPAAPRAIAMVAHLSDETLFYIFYAMPRDVMQEAAAQELYNRAWRFHKELKLWLCKDASMDGVLVKGAGFERGVYIFFDPSSWSRVKKEWVLYYDQLEERTSLDSSAATPRAHANGNSGGGSENGLSGGDPVHHRTLSSSQDASSGSGLPSTTATLASTTSTAIAASAVAVTAGAPGTAVTGGSALTSAAAPGPAGSNSIGMSNNVFAHPDGSVMQALTAGMTNMGLGNGNNGVGDGSLVVGGLGANGSSSGSSNNNNGGSNANSMFSIDGLRLGGAGAIGLNGSAEKSGSSGPPPGVGMPPMRMNMGIGMNMGMNMNMNLGMGMGMPPPSFMGGSAASASAATSATSAASSLSTASFTGNARSADSNMMSSGGGGILPSIFSSSGPWDVSGTSGGGSGTGGGADVNVGAGAGSSPNAGGNTHRQ